MERTNAVVEFGQRLWDDDSGQDLVEYALLLVFIALAAIAVVQLLGDQVSSIFGEAESQLSSGT